MPRCDRTLRQHHGDILRGDWESVESNFVATRAFADEIEVDIFIEAPLTLFPPTIPIWKEYEDRGSANWDYDAIETARSSFHEDPEQSSGARPAGQEHEFTSPKKAFHAVTSGTAARAF